MKAKAVAKPAVSPVPPAAPTWRVIFPSGSIVDFPNSEVKQYGPLLTLTRNGQEIGVFQTWAGYHVVEAAP